MSKLVAFLVSISAAAGVLIPVAAYAIGFERGPCEIAVQCVTGEVITCDGIDYCQWRLDDPDYPNHPGYVQCDGGRTYC